MGVCGCCCVAAELSAAPAAAGLLCKHRGEGVKEKTEVLLLAYAKRSSRTVMVRPSYSVLFSLLQAASASSLLLNRTVPKPLQVHTKVTQARSTPTSAVQCARCRVAAYVLGVQLHQDYWHHVPRQVLALLLGIAA